jgi:hypothetical protein
LGAGDNSFHTYRADPAAFKLVATTRVVSPAVSSDGRIIVFASAEDLVGQNHDRNSEIYLFDGSKLSQLTQTEPDSIESRLRDGNV